MPTTEKGTSVLDLFATSRPNTITKLTVSEPISDRCTVSVLLRTHGAIPRLSSTVYQTSTGQTGQAFETHWRKLPLLHAILGATHVNVAWTTWRNIISDTYSHRLSWNELS